VTLTVGSMFSGIGGLDLGLERAGMSVVWQAEVDPYCSRVLAKHWPHVPNLGDVTQVDWSEVERPDVICGGYPCQPFSQAARGRNNAVNLWPHMRTVVDALRPSFVLLENVASHLGRGWPVVLADLDALGFDVEWSVVSACAFGAPHTRRRLFAVAYPHGSRESVLAFDEEVAGVSTPTADGRHGWLPSPDDVRADDGVPHRVERLRALGNAVVPQVAEFIGQQLLAACLVEENPQ
jgi:DNA (cytosine-5)-methyltransferase 1